MSQYPSIYQAPVSSMDNEDIIPPRIKPVLGQSDNLKILYVIQQEYPVRAVITVMTLEVPYEGHYVGQLKKVEHRYSTKYIPINHFEGLTPAAEGTEQDMSEHKIEDGALMLYFQV
jgi:hypothetical protein